MVGRTLPQGWRWLTLAAVAAPQARAVLSGPFGSNISSRFFVESGVPVIRGNNLTCDMTKFLDEGFVFVTEEKADELACDAIVNDLVFTAAGSLGQVGIIPQNARFPRYVISNKQLRARLNTEIVHPVFAFYWFASPVMVSYIQQRNTGSSVPLINLSVLRSLPIPLPPLAEQTRIVEILGTLDDKIEVNRRMSETLEGTARAIFESWFVDFSPVRANESGHEPRVNDSLARFFPSSWTETATGPIPAGWTVGTLGQVADQVRATIPAGDIDPSTPYIGLEHMPRRSIALTRWDSAETVESNKARFERGDILFGKLRPYFHKVGVAPVDGVCSTDIVVLRPKNSQWFGFVLSLVSSDAFVEHTNAGSTGTKMPRTSWAEMARYEVVLPDPVAAEAFTAVVRPLVDRIIAGIHESRTLAAIRDALLPKLLSGELRVKQAERAVEAVL